MTQDKATLAMIQECDMYKRNRLQHLSILALALALFAPACGDDEADPDAAHLEFSVAPPETMTAGTAVDVTWMVHTEGDLHHTEIRACEGHADTCGLGGADSFDLNFAATAGDASYTASLSFDAAAHWTVVVFAHVGETPHVTKAIHISVE